MITSRSINQIRIKPQHSLLVLFLGSVVFSGFVMGQQSTSSSEASFSRVNTLEANATIDREADPARKSIQQISDKIDSLVEAKLSSEGLKRNKLSSDSVFLRRVYLDIIGRIPDLQETQSFSRLQK